MHDLSLVQGLLSRLDQLAGEHGHARVVRAVVALGREGCCVPATFRFLFDTLKGEWEAVAGAELILEEAEGADLVLLRVEMEEVERV